MSNEKVKVDSSKELAQRPSQHKEYLRIWAIAIDDR